MEEHFHTTVISLGSSCDAAFEIKRRGLQSFNYYFDFIWNEFDGLKNVTNIIKSDFKNLDSLENYTKTDKTQPFLNSGYFNINKFYPSFVFMHYDSINQGVIDSLNRKIARTKLILESNNQKIFIYYRRIDLKTDPKCIIDETIEFCEMYSNKYNSNFVILSLIMLDRGCDKDELDMYTINLQKHNTKNIKFDFVFKVSEDDLISHELGGIQWENIFKKYNIGLQG